MPPPPMITGLLLFTGGEGRRLGGPKHDRPHPSGSSWGGHLVRCFEALRPGAPVQILGAPLTDHPHLPHFEDPRQGPAVALRCWAQRSPRSEVRHWLILPCDQVAWTLETLGAWLERAEVADPDGTHWVLPVVEERDQYLGSLLGAALLPRIAHLPGSSLWAFSTHLPLIRIPTGGPHWQDVDEPEDAPPSDPPPPPCAPASPEGQTQPGKASSSKTSAESP